MAYISQISEDEASGLLQQAYELARDRSGGLANIIRIMSHDVETLNASMQFYVKLMKSPNALSSQQKEMLATVVSAANDCYYWTLSHSHDFGLESKDPTAATALTHDYRQARLSAADLALCAYAVKLTLNPHTMTNSDVAQLQTAGFSDGEITIAVQVIAYFNYINRVADGLGVDLEDSMNAPIGQWQADKTDFREN